MRTCLRLIPSKHNPPRQRDCVCTIVPYLGHLCILAKPVTIVKPCKREVEALEVALEGALEGAFEVALEGALEVRPWNKDHRQQPAPMLVLPILCQAARQ